MSNVIVFDLDGVITSEEAYWTTAGLVLHELLYSPHYWNIAGATVYQPPVTAEQSIEASQSVLPEPVIIGLKARAVNSNWDTCYAAVSLCLIDLLAQLPDCSSLLPLRPHEADWLAAFRALLGAVPALSFTPTLYQRLKDPLFHGYTGLELLECLNVYASNELGAHIEGVFARYSPSWIFCQQRFQEWYLGDTLYTQQYGAPPVQTGKLGCIYLEQPLLPVERLRGTLGKLREQGYILGVATGRPGQEAIIPLKNYGLFDYFDETRVKTHADVAVAEAAQREQGEKTSLVKPHPYQFLIAYDPDYEPGQPLLPHGSFVVVGDTTSDVRGGRAAGAVTVAVLTGARTELARQLLEESGPDFTVADVTHVPALLERIDDLATIQKLQFAERSKAELLLQRWFARHMDLQVESVTLTPKAVSLNSFNGVYRSNGEEYFFKTHVEEQGILEEYYHAEMLFNAGYNIVSPLRTLHQKGQQMVIYPVVHWPVMFDLLRAIETGPSEHKSVELLVAAEKRECERLLEIYAATLAQSSADEHASAPIHQLFWHRLTGGRLKHFYEGKEIPLPAQSQAQKEQSHISFEELLKYRWIVNGHEIDSGMPTLGELIARAQKVLQPMRAMQTVIGHGDAHFGNVFLEEQQLYKYFDPAFAGRHTPLLDIVKPFFHNVFATWMYFPQEVAQDLRLTVRLREQERLVELEHTYALAPIRHALWRTKVENLLHPLLTLLQAHNALPADWLNIFRLALMCCPLLTVNLLDETRRSAEVCWLGLAQTLQMGNLSREELSL